MTAAAQRCGNIAIIGIPNAGKSTLFNRLIKHHLSAVTHKPQTTRRNIRGVLTEGDSQMAFIDTPGIHRQRAGALNRELNRNAKSTLYDADVIVMITSCHRWTRQDEDIYELIADIAVPRILALNKIDLLENKSDLLPLIKKLDAEHEFDVIIPISVLRDRAVDELKREIISRLPRRAFLFADDMVSDQSDEVVITELIREKLMQYSHGELPYITDIEVESIEKKEGLRAVTVNILADKPGRRAILVGAGGSKLKLIGSAARKQMEQVLGTRVYLNLRVKEKKSSHVAAYEK